MDTLANSTTYGIPYGVTLTSGFIAQGKTEDEEVDHRNGNRGLKLKMG